MKRKRLKKKHQRLIIAAVIVFILLLIPVAELEQFAEDAERKFSILQLLLRSLVSIVKEIASLLSEVLRL